MLQASRDSWTKIFRKKITKNISELYLGVVPGGHVGQDGGHLVLDVDAGADVVGQVLQEDAHRPKS